MSINKVFLSGNLTRDAEVKAAPSGVTIVEFGLAVNERVKSGNEWTDRANYFKCVMFGRLGEALYNNGSLTRGQKVALEGHLRYEAWEKDGQQRTAIKVIVDEIEVPKVKTNQNASGTSSDSGFIPYVPQNQVYTEGIPF